MALDVTSRTLVVGSPLADYDKLGSDEPETYDTRPDKAEARARGKVYVYYSKPSAQVRAPYSIFIRASLSFLELGELFSL